MELNENKYYLQALEYIKTHDLNALPLGKNVIDGDNLYVNVCDSQMRTQEAAVFEAHNAYIDIQVPLSKGETYGIKPRTECTSPKGEFDEKGDCILFNDPVEKTISAQIGEAVTFAPDMAHAPLIGEGTIHKVIFKVKVL